jgi:hypothetical protein
LDRDTKGTNRSKENRVTNFSRFKGCIPYARRRDRQRLRLSKSDLKEAKRNTAWTKWPTEGQLVEDRRNGRRGTYSKGTERENEGGEERTNTRWREVRKTK